MAIPFALPLESYITDKNKLAASENVPDSLKDIALAGDNIEFKTETGPNYSVVGTPTIEDNIVSGFNSSSCLTTENPFVAEECTAIEIVLVFEVPAVASVPIIANAIPGTNPYFRVAVGSSGSLGILYTDTIGEAKTASTKAFIAADTKTWYKAVYDASAGIWTHYNSTDEGVTWIQLNVSSNHYYAPSLETGNLLYWGKNGENQGVGYFNGKIYLEDCYIKTTSASGEKALKFFKETGKTTVSATVPEVDLTGYVQNTATGTDALSILGTPTSAIRGTNIGVSSRAERTGGTAIGYGAKTYGGNFATAIGSNTEASKYWATAIGSGALALGTNSIQLGSGTNTEDCILKVGLPPVGTTTRPTTEEEGLYTLLRQDGTIPKERLINAPLPMLTDIALEGDNITFSSPMIVNVNKTGNTYIDENANASVFSETDYLTSKSQINSNTPPTSYEMAFAITPLNTSTYTQVFASDLSGSGNQSRCAFRIISGRLTFTDAAFSIQMQSSIPMTSGQKYYVKLRFNTTDGYALLMSTSNNDNAYEIVAANSSTTPGGYIYSQGIDATATPYYMLLGKYNYDSNPASFGGIIHLEDCYIKVDNVTRWNGVTRQSNKIYINSKDSINSLEDLAIAGNNINIDTFKTPNYSIVGNDVTVRNNIAEDFTPTSYISINNPIATNVPESFEINLKIKLLAVSDRTQCLFFTAANGDTYSVLINVSPDGQLIFAVKDLNNIEQYVSTSSYCIKPGVEYWVKAKASVIEGMNIYISTDGISFTKVSLQDKIFNGIIPLSATSVIGMNPLTSSNVQIVGYVDLNECYILLNSKEVWRGVTQTSKSTISSSALLTDLAIAGDNITFTPKGAISNFSTVGTPTVNNNILSGLSSTSYAKTTNPFYEAYSSSTTVTDFECAVKFTTARTLRPAYLMYSKDATSSGTGATSIGLYISSSGQVRVLIKDGSSPRYIQTDPNIISINTTYWLKALLVKNNYLFVYLSTDGKTYNLLGSLRLTNGFNTQSSSQDMLIGYNTDFTGYFFNGSIDLSESYININNSEVWRGYYIDNHYTISSTTSSVDQTYDSTSANAQSGVAINGAKFLRNTATGSDAISILGSASGVKSVAIGSNSNASQNNSVAIGNYAAATGYTSVAVGMGQATGNYAIQLGTGTNSTANTMNVGLSSSLNVQLLDANGNIPAERLVNAPAPDLTGYVQNTATKTNSITLVGNAETGVQATNIGFGSTASGDYSIAVGNAQATNQFTVAVGSAVSGSETTASGENSIAIGAGSKAISGSTVSIGFLSEATSGMCVGTRSKSTSDFGLAVGTFSQSNNVHAIQFGAGTNNEANSCYIATSQDDNWKMLGNDGKIPVERMSLMGETAPTTETVGSVGQFYTDTVTGYSYRCSAVTTDETSGTTTYTWTRLLENIATGENSLAIEGSTETAARATAIGFNSRVTKTESTSLGYNASTNSRRNVALGAHAGIYTANGASAIGYGAQVQSAESAIQIGHGRNTTPHTLAVGLGAWDAQDRPTTEEGGEYILLQADGKIPLGRFPEEITSKQDKLNSTNDIKVYQNADNFNIVGTDVTIDEDKVATNFYSSNSYLTANSVLFTQETSTDHTSFEVVVSFSAPTLTGNLIVLREMLESGSSPAYNIRVVNGVLNSMVRGGTITGTTTLSADVKYYAKLKFIKGSGYYLYLSTDGKKWMLEGSATSDASTLPPVSYLGTFDIGYSIPRNSKIFLKETYISIDGEEVWKAATVSSAVLSAPPLIEVSAPTTNTIGSIGQILVDTATGTGYMCVGVDTATPAYTWKQIT